MRVGQFLRLCLLISLAGAVGSAATVETLPALSGPGIAARDVRIYLPPGGARPDTPVLIALDGQNMSAWKLEETLAALADSRRMVPPLVVAIPAADRLEEYGLAETVDYAGRGKRSAEFQRFVLEVVLPAVRQRYGVTAAPPRTGVMGASLGGLAAFDLAWRHPEVFGFAGIFSGSFWWRADNTSAATQQTSRLVHQLVHAKPPAARPGVRWWFEAGTRDETDDRDGNGVIDAIQDTTELVAELDRARGTRPADLRYVEVAGGEHNEATWARALPQFLEWALPASNR